MRTSEAVLGNWQKILMTVAALAALLYGTDRSLASAYTAKDTRLIFDNLDPAHKGKVTRVDFDMNKIKTFYFSRANTPMGEVPPLKFKDTKLSRAFFDKADQGHKGYLDGLDIIDAFKYDHIDTKHRGYFDYADLVTYLNKIGR